MSNILPLFSVGFRKILVELVNTHNSKIGKYLLRADTLIEGWNSHSPSDVYKMLLNKDVGLWEILEELTNKELNTLINETVRMLDIRSISSEEATFEISFLPKGKQPEYNEENKWSRKNRQTGKPTRIIKRLINSKEFVDADYELFNNQLKAIVDQQGTFNIVSGEEISFWYNEDQYIKQSGSLGNSCMKHDECQSYFKVYEKHAKMLILTKNDKLLGRAIIWEIDDKIYMDRVYVYMDHLTDMFILYAQDHKWYYREHQSCLDDGEEIYWFGPDDNYQNSETIELNIHISNMNEMPYMDSFRYYNRENNIITTVFYSEYDCLSNTDGSLSNTIREACESCGTSERFDPENGPDDLCWSEIDDCYYCTDCCVYSDTLGYIRASRAVLVKINRRRSDWLLENELEDDSDYVQIDDQWYDKNHEAVMYNEKTETYYI